MKNNSALSGSLVCVFAACATLVAEVQTPAANEIMAKVAANQERSLEARKQWVYEQESVTRLSRPGGKLAREERKRFVVTPTAGGHEKKTVFRGYRQGKGDLQEYRSPDEEVEGIDAELAEELADEIASDDKSRDGLAPGLFPLTAREQAKHDYRLLGRETYRGRPVYRLSFKPKAGLADSSAWKGEALIDAEEYQPVFVTSDLAKRIPMAVKILLGTNLKGLGFSVAYEKVDDGVWFPSSIGGEFHLRAVFFYSRNISVDVKNSGFRRVDVQSRVVDYAEAKPDQSETRPVQ